MKRLRPVIPQAVPWSDVIEDDVRSLRGRGRKVGRSLCTSRTGVMRQKHTFDKDGRCLFCPRCGTPPVRQREGEQADAQGAPGAAA